MRDGASLRWPIAELRAAYRAGTISPVEVAEAALRRIEEVDPQLHAFVSVAPELTLAQAQAAAAAYRRGEDAPLLGVPVSVKDVFHVRDMVTTLGSLVHRNHRALADSGLVRRLRAAGAVFTGKTNTAEFGQSATTDNLLGPATRNPWDPARTPGGSSGGAAASVAAGLSTAAVGSDGGGSIRIPAAFTGLYGFKPTADRCRDEEGFRAMTPFVSPGPLAARVADARAIVDVLIEGQLEPAAAAERLVIGWCPRPEGRPVDPGVAAVTADAVSTLAELGHEIVEVELPLDGWSTIFGPLVLYDEHRERGHLLELAGDALTAYERRTLQAARKLPPSEIDRARTEIELFRRRIAQVFADVEVIATPAVAITAFPLDERPSEIAGVAVDSLWGPFPFAAPFNVAGTPAASVPCGLAGGLPVGLQLVAARGQDARLLDLSQAAEEALAFDPVPLPEQQLDTLGSNPR